MSNQVLESNDRSDRFQELMTRVDNLNPQSKDQVLGYANYLAGTIGETLFLLAMSLDDAKFRDLENRSKHLENQENDR